MQVLNHGGISVASVSDTLEASSMCQDTAGKPAQVDGRSFRMTFQRAHYPSHWPHLAHTAKEAAGWRCAACGAMQGSIAISQRNRLYRVALAACHLDHDPANPAPRLAAYCQACL